MHRSLRSFNVLFCHQLSSRLPSVKTFFTQTPLHRNLALDFSKAEKSLSKHVNKAKKTTNKHRAKTAREKKLEEAEKMNEHLRQQVDKQLEILFGVKVNEMREQEKTEEEENKKTTTLKRINDEDAVLGRLFPEYKKMLSADSQQDELGSVLERIENAFKGAK